MAIELPGPKAETESAGDRDVAAIDDVDGTLIEGTTVGAGPGKDAGASVAGIGPGENCHSAAIGNADRASTTVDIGGNAVAGGSACGHL